MPSLPIQPLAELGGNYASDGAPEYEYIIVGGGTAGCVLASRLSLLPGEPRVLLLERGAGVHQTWISNVPLLSTAFQMDSGKAYTIPTTPQEGLKDKICDLVGGKILGGTSRMNSSLYTRGLPAEFNRWAKEYNLPSWSYDALLPHFIASQSHSTFPSPLPDKLLCTQAPPSANDAISRGSSGPWQTSTPINLNHPPVVPFVDSAMSLGIPLVGSLNDPGVSASAVALHELTGEQGRRGSAAEFLWGDKGGFGSGLSIGMGAVVERLEIDAEGTCTGVWFGDEEGQESYFAGSTMEVILSAGTLFSPQILLLSGIGPRDELEKHKIDVKIDLPDVGKNLTDHVGVYVPYSVPYDHSLDCIETSPLFAFRAIASFLYSRSGAFTFQGSQGCIMTSSSHVPELLASDSPYSKENPLVTNPLDPAEIPDIEILPLPMRYHCSLDDGSPTGKTQDLRGGQYDKSKGYFTPISVLVSPKSTGEVTLASTSPREFPICNPRFLTHPDDLRALVQGLRLTKRLLARMRASGYPVVPHGKFYPFNDGNTDDEKKSAAGEAEEEPDVVLADYVRTWGAPCYHMSSTCAIRGEGVPGGVCDEAFRVQKTRGLRVADASVFPGVLAAHTQAAVVMVAEKCSALLAAEWSDGKRQRRDQQ